MIALAERVPLRELFETVAVDRCQQREHAAPDQEPQRRCFRVDNLEYRTNGFGWVARGSDDRVERLGGPGVDLGVGLYSVRLLRGRVVTRGVVARLNEGNADAERLHLIG